MLYRHSRPMFPAFTHFDMDALPPGVNPSRFPQWAFDIVHVVPNFVIGPQANTHSIMWFWPIDHETTDIRVQRFAFRSNKPSDRIAQAHSRVRGREVLREDLATMETNYQSVASGALPHIVLSQQELLIQNHYRAADELLAGGGTPGDGRAHNGHGKPEFAVPAAGAAAASTARGDGYLGHAQP